VEIVGNVEVATTSNKTGEIVGNVEVATTSNKTGEILHGQAEEKQKRKVSAPGHTNVPSAAGHLKPGLI
jgi:hypothetical protein